MWSPSPHTFKTPRVRGTTIRPAVFGLNRPELQHQARELDPSETASLLDAPPRSVRKLRTARGRADAQQIDIELALEAALRRGVDPARVASLSKSEKAALACSWRFIEHLRETEGALTRYLLAGRLNADALHKGLKEHFDWSWRARKKPPGINATTKAVSVINEIFMQTPDKTGLPRTLRDQITAIKRELAICQIQLSVRGSDRELAERTGLLALGLARTLVNNQVMEGQSLSELPAEVDLDASDRHALQHLIAAKKDGTLEASRVVNDLTLALSEFERDRRQFPLAVAAVKCALLLLPPNTAAGFLAQVNLAYCGLPVLGRPWFLSENLALLERLDTLDARASRRLAGEIPELKIVDEIGIEDLLLFNVASFSLAVALIDEQDLLQRTALVRQAKTCLDRFQPLTERAGVGASASNREAIRQSQFYLRALGISVAEALELDGEFGITAREFWTKLGREAALEARKSLVQHEFWEETCKVARQSVDRVYAGPARQGAARS